MKPNLQHIRIFGSIGYVHVPKEKRRKLDKKSVKMLLVGYDHDNYRMYDENTKKIIISRDVKFDECSTTEQKQSFMEVTAEQEDQSKDSTSQDELQHVINQQDNFNEENSLEDSMKSLYELDETYVLQDIYIWERKNREMSHCDLVKIKTWN